MTVTAAGFEAKSTDTILTELEQAEKAVFGQSWNVSPRSLQGILNGVLAAKFAELYDVAAGVYQAFNPDAATDRALDQLCALTGVVRLAAVPSTATITVTGTNGTVLSVGQLRVRHASNGSYWRNTTGGTISGGTLSVEVECETTGPTSALAGTLTVIDAPISGVASVTNATDAAEGRDLESNAALRARREELLTAKGRGTVDAVRAAVREVPGVLQAFVFENTTNVTDGDGRPAKSIEAVVLTGAGADSQAILDAIWRTKATGIEAFASPTGGVTGNVTDDQGFTQLVGYTEAQPVNAYYALTAATGGAFGASAAGVAAIKQALVDYGATLLVDDDGYRSVAEARAYVSGVINITAFRQGTAPAPTGTADIPVSGRQILSVDSSRITVHLV